jgi:hypothetical protein
MGVIDQDRRAQQFAISQYAFGRICSRYWSTPDLLTLSTTTLGLQTHETVTLEFQLGTVVVTGPKAWDFCNGFASIRLHC